MIDTPSTHTIEEGSFDSHFVDKAHIYYKHYHPLKSKRSSKKMVHIIFQHGMIEYHRRHEDLFNALIKYFDKNIIISAMDLFGHGLSGGERAYIDHFETYTHDMLHFFDLCKERFYKEGDVITLVIAHSLGALITLRTLSDLKQSIPFKIDGCIFTNPCIAPKLELFSGIKKMAENLPELISRIRIPLIYSAQDITHDKEKIISFIHDYLISKSVTIKLATETLKAIKNINSLSYFFMTPCFFILSGEDKVVDNEKTQLFITGMDKKLVKIKRYPGMHHDILNETCRNDVFRETIKYIECIRGQHA